MATISDIEGREATAVKRCRDEISWYTKHKLWDRTLFQTTQTLALAFGGLAPVLVAMDYPKHWLALFAALAAFCTALNGTFRFRENWARFGMAAELLQSELNMFQTRTTAVYRIDLDREVVLSSSSSASRRSFALKRHNGRPT